MRFHGSIFPDSLAGLGANCETEAEMRAGCKNQIVSTPAPAPVPSYPADVVNLVAQILPAQSWVSKGLTGGMNIATIRKSVLDATQMFPQLPLKDVAKFIAETTADYIKHGGKTNRAIVNLKLESDGAGGTIATPYPLTFSLGKKWKCAGSSGQLMSDQMWNQIVKMYGEAGAKSRVDDAYCGPDKHRALKAFAIGAATLIIGGVASAYLAPATAASGGAVAGASSATGAAGTAGATTATTAGAASALTAAAIPAGVEVVTVAAAPIVSSAATVATAITAGAVVASAAAPAISSPTVNNNPTPPETSNPPAPSTPISEVIETVTTTASAPAPIAANVANAITAGAVITAAAPPVLSADPPIETVTTQATRIEQMPVDQATTISTGLVSVGIQMPDIPDIAPPEPVEVEGEPSGEASNGSLLSDTVKQNIQDAIAQYGADWVKQHLVDILADSTGVYPSDPVYDDALDYIDAGAPMQAAMPWWIFAGLAGGFLLMAATQKKGKRRARVRRVKRK